SSRRFARLADIATGYGQLGAEPLRFEPQILRVAVELVELPLQGVELLGGVGAFGGGPPHRRAPVGGGGALGCWAGGAPIPTQGVHGVPQALHHLVQVTHERGQRLDLFGRVARRYGDPLDRRLVLPPRYVHSDPASLAFVRGLLPRSTPTLWSKG